MNMDGSTIIAGVDQGNLFITTNGGITWAKIQPAGNVKKQWFTTSITPDGNKIIAGALGGRLYISSDRGVNWNELKTRGDAGIYWLTT